MNTDISIGKNIVDVSNEKIVSDYTQNESTEILANSEFHKASVPRLAIGAALPSGEMGKFLQRGTKLATWGLASTDVPITTFAALQPYQAYFSNTANAAKARNFKFAYGTFKVDIVVNASPGTYGLYMITAVPRGVRTVGGGDISLTNSYVESFFQMPHILINVSESNNGSLILPWIYDKDYASVAELSTNDSEACGVWQINLTCLVPMASGNGATTPSGTVSIFGNFMDDFQLVVPMRQGFDDMRDSVNDAMGMKPSAIAGGVAATAGALSGVPVIGAFAAPIAAGAAAIGSILDWFGFTREADPQTPSIFVERPFSNIVNVNGQYTGEVSAMMVDNAVTIDPKLASGLIHDESSFDAIFARWTMVGTIPWATTAIVNDQLAAIPVTPFLTRTAMDEGGGAMFTSAGFVGFPFQYWRGDMEFKFLIPVSQFHRGTLQIAWYPDGAVSAEDPTNTTYNCIVDVADGQSVSMSVGYSQAELALNTIPHKFGATIASTSGANGLLIVRVVNPLLCGVTTAGTSIIVLARAKSNMRFYSPRQTFRPLTVDGSLGPTRDFATGFALQGKGALGDDQERQERHVDLVPGAAVYPLKDICFGEEISSVRALVQKFSFDPYISRMFDQNPSSIQMPLLHFRPAPLNTLQELAYYNVTNAGPTFTWAGYYMCMFTGIAGSVRYSMVNTDDVTWAYGVTTQDLLGFSASTRLHTLNHANITQAGKAFEVTVPYYNPYKFINPTYQFSANNVATGSKGRNDVFSIVHPMETAYSNGPSVAVFSALGSDVRFSLFRNTRRISSLVTSTLSPVYGNDPAVIP